MAKIHFKGKPVNTGGELPKVGSKAPDFKVTKDDLSELSLQELQSDKVVLNIFPSLDTSTCAMSVRKFNELASQMPGVKVLCISADLPFAQKRFCGAENLQNVITGSVFRHPEFGQRYGVIIAEGPLAGLLSRCVVVLNQGKVIYTQQVAEITEEPDYQAALEAIKAVS